MRILLKKAWGVALLALALTLAAGSVWAAGQKEGAGAGEPMVITMTGRNTTGNDTEDSWCMDQLEEKFGVEIDIIGITRSDREKLELLIASGEFPTAASSTNRRSRRTRTESREAYPYR